MAKSESQMRALLRGVNKAKTGPKLTADPASASAIRDPKTGELHRRGSEQFRKMEAAHAAR